ncbi:aminotransferase class V-fold PLP-dependent enzyme [Microbacterium kyungheense]|uniref:Cysteine desulfurase/selenocysteine lyase n=1 Tax=Microbacterium kyungheense TaxID=1263636 RepID=A0A543F2K8_9MICO|nr:aminotransferase class V-fold PLP-dependent enzyme [Microbacterium kyungheense]TQM28048.1 cysteine desulfurase/selenocysteine lyase [Microbacterium kyungheense]TQM28063.1 cysteine desulfurase/selenocysteine lyase [Microbacterium kyungheense]
MGTLASRELELIRSQFAFSLRDRIVTNNAASTQPPLAVLELLRDLSETYENVHRGQSDASIRTTEMFEASFDTIAAWINAPSRRTLSMHRSTTEAINAVMYSLLADFRDGDNVVTTLMEHNSDYVPWHAMCREILPRFGRHVEVRLARFDHESGELDLAHLAELVDARTKLVCCTGGSNFLGTKPPLDQVRAIADAGGYVQPDGRVGALLLVDAAQRFASSRVDVQEMEADFVAFSFHKLLAPFGVGVLYAREDLRETLPPFLYGGDMIAEGQVFPDRVEYNDLPWKFSAGTPNILGVIASAQTLRLIVDLVGADPTRAWFRTDDPLEPGAVDAAMAIVAGHAASLTRQAMEGLSTIAGLRIHGASVGEDRTPLVAFTVEGRSPFAIAHALNAQGVESRAGCHCATLAHHDLGLEPAASCRVSFTVYNTPEEVDRVVAAVRRAVDAPHDFSSAGTPSTSADRTTTPSGRATAVAPSRFGRV